MGEWNVLVTNDSISINKHLLRFVCNTPPSPPQKSIYNTTRGGWSASGCFTLLLNLVVMGMVLLLLETVFPLLCRCNNDIYKLTVKSNLSLDFIGHNNFYNF